jgi:hypothetical protein
LINPKRASSKAKTFSGFLLEEEEEEEKEEESCPSLSALTFSANFFWKPPLLFLVGLLVARPPGFQLHLLTPKKTSDTFGVSVMHSLLQEEFVSLGYGGDLAPLHIAASSSLGRLLGGNELLGGATLVYPAHQKLLQTLLAIGDEPPLALTPAVSEGFGCLSEVRALLGLLRSLSILTRGKRWLYRWRFSSFSNSLGSSSITCG